MKRFFLLMLSLWKQQIKLYAVAALIGAAIGVFILAPSYNFIYSQESNNNKLSSLEYVFGQLASIFDGNNTEDNLLLFYAEIGAMLGLFTVSIYGFLHKRLARIESLKAELQKDLAPIIAQGEGPHLEFKSSFRWDLEQSRINRTLESVVLKTLAGFMNSRYGGTLLIGVADDGTILGLDKDYQSLKKPNQDGFEQAIMTAISTNLGADLCNSVHVLFHVIDHKDICRLIISPAHRPVFLAQNGMPKLFVRTGGATRDLNIQEALEFVPIRWKGQA
ncbi:MAG: ATP-binding protein [Methylobacter sp.]|uniref:AlbA family DNA-binding domain-containing protein n=1 Tax=Methylovulum miyakonense TaxID=645578 RepID=UPI0003707239|nr:ATP-binding protein [Methylovulum miyakonense]PPD50246.1 MAG: ATP-binding protein [Methylobacter sp.]